MKTGTVLARRKMPRAIGHIVLLCTAAAAVAVLLDGSAGVALGAAEAVSTAKITYVTTVSVYVAAGKEEGLALGDVLEVVRDGAVVAKLKVTFLSSHRASCTIEGTAPSLVAGDIVRFRVAAGMVKPEPPAAGAPATPQTGAVSYAGEGAGSARETSWLRAAGLRGRIGVRYLAIRDRTSTGEDLSEPGLDLRLDGTQIGGAPVDLSVDVRAQRTYRTPPVGSQINDSQTRVYRMSASWRPGPMRLTFGRQFSPSLSVVSLFDGVLAEYRQGRWGAGVMAGTQPDATYGTSSDVHEYGAFFEFGSTPGNQDRWRLTSGVIGSYSHGEINREFLYVQGSYNNRIVSTYLTQEVDVNRGWRKTAEGSSFSGTSTFAFVRVRPMASFSFDGGYDNRRNIRLYRDFVTPETEFDDAHRQGFWGGAEWRPRERFFVGFNGRRSSGGSSGTADSYTAIGGVRNLIGAWGLDASLRATRYTSDFVDGTLFSVSAGARIGAWGQWEVHGGSRNETDPNGFAPDRTITWEGVDFDILLGRQWFGLLSYERTSGGGEDNDQIYAGLSFRF